MSIFKIEQLTVHMQTFCVEADSEGEAIVKLFDGDGALVIGSDGVADICDERGLFVGDHPNLAEDLRQAGIMSNETVIPSISAIERVSDSDRIVISSHGSLREGVPFPKCG